MKPTQLAQILLRLFAISWFLYGIVQTAGILAMNQHGMPDPKLLVSGAVASALAIAAWFLAPALGRRIASPENQESDFSTITYEQLLKAMFIGIGLYFALSSIGALINSLHFHLVMKTAPESIPLGMRFSPYDLSKHAITFAAGVSLIASASHWSRRLSNK